MENEIKACDRSAEKYLLYSNEHGKMYHVDRIPSKLVEFYILKKRSFKDGTSNWEIGLTNDYNNKDFSLTTIRGTLEDAEREFDELLGIKETD